MVKFFAVNFNDKIMNQIINKEIQKKIKCLS